MIAIENVHAIFLLSTLLLAAAGKVFLLFGSRFPRHGRAAAGAVLGLGAIGYVLCCLPLAEQHWQAQRWIRGWIWPHEAPGAMTVGLQLDALGMVLALVSVLLAAIALASPTHDGRENRTLRPLAALLLSTASVALTWSSATPWLALFGLVGVVFAGFVALGVRWENNGEAATAARFIGERGFGLLATVLGACVLAGTRDALTISDSFAASTGPTWQDLFGASLLAAGALVQTGPFPFLGGATGPSSLSLPFRSLTTQVFPAFAAFGLLTRFEAPLRAIGIFQFLGWAALASAALSAISGLVQKTYPSAFRLWGSSLMAIAAAVLSFSGAATAFPVLICAGLGSFALSLSAEAIEIGGQNSQSNRKRAGFAKTFAAFSVLAATGMIGFSSSGALATWISQAWAEPAILVAQLFVLLLATILAWRIFWLVRAAKGATEAPWALVLVSAIPILLSLGVLLDGTVSGGVIPDSPDRVMNSALAILFPGAAAKATDAGNAPTVLAALFGCLVVAAGIAAWTSARASDAWLSLHEKFPRFAGFLATGYGMDSLFDRVLSGLDWLGTKTERAVGQVFWSEWVPRALQVVVSAVSRAANWLDGEVYAKARQGLRRAVEVPTKVLQLIQNGDVQWYLFFGVGSGLALLGHFMRIRG